VNTKRKIKSVLKEHYGSFNSYLEKEYANAVTTQLLSKSLRNKESWATYNQVILELKNNLKDLLKVKELQYRLTDYEDPQNACIDVLENVQTKTPELERLYYKIRNFK
jgi:hypothetical protein